MSMAEEIFEQSKKLSPTLQREALEFVHFLADRQQPIDPDAPEFTSELIAAFADLSRQTMNRQLRRLAAAHLVGLERGLVSVYDAAALAGVAAGRNTLR